MVHPSIISAHALINLALRGTEHQYDSDYMPRWVITEVDVSAEIEAWKIEVSILPTELETTLVEALTDWHISANIEAIMDDESTLQSQRMERW